MGVYEDRVKRLHDHVVRNERNRLLQEVKEEESQQEGEVKEDQSSAVPTNKELMALLDQKGIEYDKKANKETLLKLVEGAE